MMAYILAAGDEIAEYPFDLARLRTPGLLLPAFPSPACLAEFGVFEVAPADPPATTTEQVAEEAPPALVDGAWTQQWTVRERTAGELAAAIAARRGEVDARLHLAFLGGFTPADGPLAGHTLQVRDATDRTNWLASMSAYSAAVAAGEGDTGGAAFRTAANETITCTYSEGVGALLAMDAWGKALMANSWTLKDAIGACATFAALAAVDIEEGWQ